MLNIPSSPVSACDSTLGWMATKFIMVLLTQGYMINLRSSAIHMARVPGLMNGAVVGSLCRASVGIKNLKALLPESKAVRSPPGTLVRAFEWTPSAPMTRSP